MQRRQTPLVSFLPANEERPRRDHGQDGNNDAGLLQIHGGPPPLKKPIGKRTSIGLAWNDQEKVHVKPLKEIILEANKEKKREEEELRRRKNVTLFRANEDPKLSREEQLKQDEELIQKFLVQIAKSDATVKKQVRLGREPERIDNPGQARPIQVTCNNDTEVNDIKKLDRLANAKDSLKHLRIHPDSSFKDRCTPEAQT